MPTPHYPRPNRDATTALREVVETRRAALARDRERVEALAGEARRAAVLGEDGSDAAVAAERLRARLAEDEQILRELEARAAQAGSVEVRGGHAPRTMAGLGDADVEVRRSEAAAIRSRAVAVTPRDLGWNVVEGYAARWYDPKVAGTEARLADGTIERVSRGAFAVALLRAKAGEIDVSLNFEHDESAARARTSDGSLTLEEDERGLRFRAVLADCGGARSMLWLVRKGGMGASFRFRGCDEAIEVHGGRRVRWVCHVRSLIDICVCRAPYYPATFAVADGEPPEG